MVTIKGLIKLKIVQYKGPFTTNSNDAIRIDPKYDISYIHIGIQIPHRQPIEYPTDRNDSLATDLRMGEDDTSTIAYKVNETGILEFDEINQSGWYIAFDKDLPAETIIDIAYQEAEDI